MLNPPEHFWGPGLVFFQHINVLLLYQRTPNWAQYPRTGFKCWTEGRNFFPQPAGFVLTNTDKYAVGLHHCKSDLLTHVQPRIICRLAAVYFLPSPRSSLKTLKHYQPPYPPLRNTSHLLDFVPLITTLWDQKSSQFFYPHVSDLAVRIPQKVFLESRLKKYSLISSHPHH